MVPIHDSDVAEKRWDEAEWRHYELWEKIEVRPRKRKWWWITLAVVLFLALSSVPVLMERWPKWVTLTAAGRLSREIGRMKRDTNVDRASFRIRFKDGAKLIFTVERAGSCSDTDWLPVRTGALLGPEKLEHYAVVSTQQGGGLGIPGLMESFCYDYLAGSEALISGKGLTGFGIIPVKDLTEGRTGRMSIVLLNGQSAEISFE